MSLWPRKFVSSVAYNQLTHSTSQQGGIRIPYGRDGTDLGAYVFDFEDAMGFLGFGKKADSNLVVVTFEGPNQLRLNGNRKKGKEATAAKKGAAAHERTVCWIEFSQGGMRLDQGKGPAVAKLGDSEVDRMLKELPFNSVCKEMLRELEAGHEKAARILSWENRNQGGKPK
jgi:hypothetical protein